MCITHRKEERGIQEKQVIRLTGLWKALEEMRHRLLTWDKSREQNNPQCMCVQVEAQGGQRTADLD